MKFLIFFTFFLITKMAFAEFFQDIPKFQKIFQNT